MDQQGNQGQGSQGQGNQGQGNQGQGNQGQGMHVDSQQQQLIADLERELQTLDTSQYPSLSSLADNELYRLRGGVSETIDIVGNKKVKIRAKINIPVDEYPQFNFVGKLLGPGGSNLKSAQEQTMTKMAILGAGSLRNPQKEQELLNSGDTKYQHLKQKLHLQIDSLAAPSEAYYRLSHALAEIKKCMTPDFGGDFGGGGMGMGNTQGGWSQGGGPGAPRGGQRGGFRGAPRGGAPRGAPGGVGGGGFVPRGAPRGGVRGPVRGGGRGGWGVGTGPSDGGGGGYGGNMGGYDQQQQQQPPPPQQQQQQPDNGFDQQQGGAGGGGFEFGSGYGQSDSWGGGGGGKMGGGFAPARPNPYGRPFNQGGQDTF